MPSSRFGSVGVSGLVMRGAWRSMEASTAPIAKQRCLAGDATLGAVGKKPSIAKPSPPRMSTRSVTITPSVNFPMDPPDGLLWQMGGGGRYLGEAAEFNC